MSTRLRRVVLGGDVSVLYLCMQIAALKKIGKGTKLILLDRYGPAARIVAKELGRKGYGKVYVIAGESCKLPWPFTHISRRCTAGLRELACMHSWAWPRASMQREQTGLYDVVPVLQVASTAAVAGSAASCRSSPLPSSHHPHHPAWPRLSSATRAAPSQRPAHKRVQGLRPSLRILCVTGSGF